MEQFFEAWVETILLEVARQTGGILRTGRARQTVAPLLWEPPYVGSQRSFVPDLVLETERTSLIVDAKYKRHWEELQETSWYEQDNALRERHRADLLQVLAYANLAPTPDIICCLCHPCSQATWNSLTARNRIFHRAELPNRGRRVQVWLTAIPMGNSISQIGAPFVELLRAQGF